METNDRRLRKKFVSGKEFLWFAMCALSVMFVSSHEGSAWRLMTIAGIVVLVVVAILRVYTYLRD